MGLDLGPSLRITSLTGHGCLVRLSSTRCSATPSSDWGITRLAGAHNEMPARIAALLAFAILGSPPAISAGASFAFFDYFGITVETCASCLGPFGDGDATAFISSAS